MDKLYYSYLAIDSRALLNTWKQRRLSLSGKVQVFKLLVALKPAYAASMVSITILGKFCAGMKFLHRKLKKKQIKLSALIEDYEGGLKDISIESKFTSIKIRWVQPLKDSNFQSYLWERGEGTPPPPFIP